MQRCHGAPKTLASPLQPGVGIGDASVGLLDAPPAGPAPSAARLQKRREVAALAQLGGSATSVAPRRPILAALTEPSADQLGDLALHQRLGRTTPTPRGPRPRAHPPGRRERPPRTSSSPRRPPVVPPTRRTVERPTIMSAAVAGPTTIRPMRSYTTYTTLRDVPPRTAQAGAPARHRGKHPPLPPIGACNTG